MQRSCSLTKRVLIAAVYMTVIIVQLYMWPNCEVRTIQAQKKELQHLWCERNSFRVSGAH